MNKRERRENEKAAEEAATKERCLTNEYLAWCYYNFDSTNMGVAFRNTRYWAEEILRLRGLKPEDVKYEREMTENVTVKRIAIIQGNNIIGYKES